MLTDASAQIIEEAREAGAALAGIASMIRLRTSPSHQLLKEFGTAIDGVSFVAPAEDIHEVPWPVEARSAVIIAVSHPPDQPELDWWDAVNSPGNRQLERIAQVLSAWMQETLGITSHDMPYWVWRGGMYVKDAAVLAGLGCIGKNNLLLTPEFGPRVRLRAVAVEAELTPSHPSGFDPCTGCEQFCRKACPQGAFDRSVLSSGGVGMSTLPGRDGFFSRARCNIQMGRDVDASRITVDVQSMAEAHTPQAKAQSAYGHIKWCRRCELACPAGG